MNLYEWEINDNCIKLFANPSSEFNRVLIAKALLKDNRIVIYYHGEEKSWSDYHCSTLDVYDIQKTIITYINYNLIKSLNNNINTKFIFDEIDNYISKFKILE